MAIVITDGTSYIRYTNTGATKRTNDINSAYQFNSIAEAIMGMKKAEGKTKIVMCSIHLANVFYGSG